MSSHICPASHAGVLDSGLRKYIHNPYRILRSFIQNSMKVADIGCGPGFFTIPMAELVGETGRVHAYDVQQDMLDKLAVKIDGTELAQRIIPHCCSADSMELEPDLDLILGFFMVHEVPDRKQLMEEVFRALAPAGVFLLSEPYIHVSKNDFHDTIRLARDTGFQVRNGPKIFFGRSVTLNKHSSS